MTAKTTWYKKRKSKEEGKEERNDGKYKYRRKEKTEIKEGKAEKRKEDKGRAKAVMFVSIHHTVSWPGG